MAGVVNYQYVILISKICRDVVFVAKVHKVHIFEFLKEEFCYLDDGAPVASPSF